MSRPKIAVWKFASCDGCQLSILDLENELLAITEAIEIAYFPEASRLMQPGPYDVSLVEGSVTTPHDLERIQEIREESGIVISIGACATAAGIQSLKNTASVDEYISTVYATPEYIDTLETSTAISDHIAVDFELRGCPVSKSQLLEAIAALVHGRKPDVPTYAVCVECKLNSSSCVMVANGTPCLGPVTQAGCGAVCPAFARGCYGCFGPKENPNTEWMTERWLDLGKSPAEIARVFSTFNNSAEAFNEAGKAANART